MKKDCNSFWYVIENISQFKIVSINSGIRSFVADRWTWIKNFLEVTEGEGEEEGKEEERNWNGNDDDTDALNYSNMDVVVTGRKNRCWKNEHKNWIEAGSEV